MGEEEREKKRRKKVWCTFYARKVLRTAEFTTKSRVLSVEFWLEPRKIWARKGRWRMVSR